MKKDRLEEGMRLLKEMPSPKQLKTAILMAVKEKERPVRLIQLQLATVMSVLLFCVSGLGYGLSVPADDPLSVLESPTSISVLSDMSLEALI